MRYIGSAALFLMAVLFAAVGAQLADPRGLAVALVLLAFCPFAAFLEYMATRHTPMAVTAAGAGLRHGSPKRGRR